MHGGGYLAVLALGDAHGHGRVGETKGSRWSRNSGFVVAHDGVHRQVVVAAEVQQQAVEGGATAVGLVAPMVGGTRPMTVSNSFERTEATSASIQACRSML